VTRLPVVAGLALLVALTTPGPLAAARSARGSVVTAPALPHLRVVPRWVTDGFGENALYRAALQLSATSRADRPVQAAISDDQQVLDQDAVRAERARRLRAAAAAAAAGFAASARRSAIQYDALLADIRSAAVSEYMAGPFGVATSGPAAPVGEPDAARSALESSWAQGLLEVTVSTDGLLAERAAVLAEANRAATAARIELRVADAAARRARQALLAERAAVGRLVTELAVVDRADAGAVAAEHATLAAEAGHELRSEDGLQFSPSSPLPAPLATTPVALAWAFAELGVPYLWGGTGDGGFDCSGLTQFVWAKAGVAIPRVAAAQYSWTDPVPLSELTPGDLVFFVGSDGTPAAPGHVGIYIGDGLMIDAPHTGTVVQVDSIWWSDLIGFGRVHADGTPVASHQPPTQVDAVVTSAGPVPSEGRPPHRRPHPATATTSRGSTTSTTATTPTTATTGRSGSDSTTTGSTRGAAPSTTTTAGSGRSTTSTVTPATPPTG
jgi:cell wall-associated NlpC family hydrolase